MLTSMLLALALGTGLTASARATALEQADSTRPDVLAEVRIQGNLLTPDDEVRRLAGLEIGMAVTPDTPADVASRLRAAGRFKRVDVLKRFASIADPTQIVIVVILDEGPVRIDTSGGPGTPARVVRRGGLRLMYLPVLSFEDGYGFSYGVRVARTGPLGRKHCVPLATDPERARPLAAGAARSSHPAFRSPGRRSPDCARRAEHAPVHGGKASEQRAADWSARHREVLDRKGSAQ